MKLGFISFISQICIRITKQRKCCGIIHQTKNFTLLKDKSYEKN